MCNLQKKPLGHAEEIHRFFAGPNVSQIGFNIQEIEAHNVSSSLNDSEKSASDIKLFMETIFSLQKADRGRMRIREFDDALTRSGTGNPSAVLIFLILMNRFAHLVFSTLAAMEIFNFFSGTSRNEFTEVRSFQLR